MTTTVRVLAVGALLLGTFGLRQQVAGQQRRAQPPGDRTTQIQADMNPRQRYHSEQFSKYRTHTRLLDLKTSVTIPSSRTVSQPRPIDDILRELTCTSEAVFMARTASAASMPIDDGTFLFTDYEVVIERMFRMPEAEKFRQPAMVGVVTRPGGMWLFRDNGNKVSATVSATASDFPFLSAGRLYLFFTKYLSFTRTFQTEEPRGVFDLGWHLGEMSAKSVVPISTNSGDLFETGISPSDLFKKLSEVACR